MANDFARELKDIRQELAERRNSNPRVLALKAGELPEDSIKLQVVQWYFHTVGFINALRRLYDRCDNAELRADLSESLYEEDTGKITGTKPHLDLYFQTAKGFGFEREKIEKEAFIFPEMAALINWYHYSCAVLHPLQGLTVLSYSAEGNNVDLPGLPGSSRIFADALKAHYGKSDRDVEFYEIHAYADQDHSEVAMQYLVKLADTEEKRQMVRTTISMCQDVYGELGSMFSRSLDECWSPESNSSARLYH